MERYERRLRWQNYRPASADAHGCSVTLPLDVYEGFPRLYRKEKVKVKFEGKAVEAMVYIMNKGRDLGIPSRYYYEVIRTGYREAGLKTNALKKAVKDSMTIIEEDDD